MLAAAPTHNDTVWAHKANCDRLVSALVRENLLEKLEIGALPPTRRVTNTGRLEVAWNHTPISPARLLEQLTAQLARINPEVATEITESTHNLKLGSARIAQRARELPQVAGGTPDWLRQMRAQDPSFSPLAFLEQMCCDGHALHPTVKVRRGMSTYEVAQFAPEWTEEVRVRLVAAHIDHVVDRGLHQLLEREHPAATHQAITQLRGRGLDPHAYRLIPVHPWQAVHELPRVFADEIACRNIVMLSPSIRARPLLSLRTLAPIGEPDFAPLSHLKLAIGVRLTGAIRGISAYSAGNGPAISELMAQIQQREQGALAVDVCAESASTSIITTDPARSAMLGAIARANPEQLASDGLLVPAAALRGASPITGRLLLAEFLDELHCGRNVEDKARRFAQRYADVVMPPLLILLSRYGIALEAHAQNSMVTIRDGEPNRLIVRDLGAVRISATRLAAHDLAVPLAEGSAPLAQDETELHNRLWYTLIHDHLGELLPALARAGQLPETELWRPFAAAARRTFSEVAACCRACRTHTERDQQSLFSPTTPLKAHLTMRLHGATHAASYIPAPNPLLAAAHQ